SVMYPLVELATGLLFVAAFFEYGVTQGTVKWLFFTCLIIVLTITDLRVRLLPDLMTWPGFAAGLVFSTIVPPNEGFARTLSWRLLHQPLQPNVAGLIDGILGAAFGGFLLWGLATGYKLVRKREGMGMGDVKMMVMIGAFLGLRGTFWTILLGSLLGSVIGLSVVVALYLGGWQRKLAERGSQRGLGTVSALRWAIASQYQLPLGTFLGIGALAAAWLVVYLLRKFFQSTKEEQKDKFAASTPGTENASAFMAASMQGVIRQLREQEKELERLHKIERERAEQTERLSEEVTRNMPAGLVVVNATGIISRSI